MLIYMETNSHKVHWLRLGDVASLFPGLALSGRSPAGRGSQKVAVVSIGDIQDGRMHPDRLSQTQVEHVSKIERYQVQPGDVLVASRGTQPKVCIVPPEAAGAVLTSTLTSIRTDSSQLLPEVLVAYLISPAGQKALLAQVRSATGQIALTVADLAEMEVPVPPLGVQRRMAELVRLTDACYAAATEAATLRRDIGYRRALETCLQTEARPAHDTKLVAHKGASR